MIFSNSVLVVIAQGLEPQFVVAILQARCGLSQNVGELSTTSRKAALPTTACDTDLASRCDCIRD